MNEFITTVVDTLLISKEDIAVKLMAILLLICIVLKFPKDYRRNQNLFEDLCAQQEFIEIFKH